MSKPESNATVQPNPDDGAPSNQTARSGLGCSSVIFILCLLTFLPSIYHSLHETYELAGGWLAEKIGLGGTSTLIVPLIFFLIAVAAILLPVQIIRGINGTESSSKLLHYLLTTLLALLVLFGLILLALLIMDLLNFIAEQWAVFLDWLFS